MGASKSKEDEYPVNHVPNDTLTVQEKVVKFANLRAGMLLSLDNMGNDSYSQSQLELHKLWYWYITKEDRGLQ